MPDPMRHPVGFVDGVGDAVTPDSERATGQEEPAVTSTSGACAWSVPTFTGLVVTGVVEPAAVLVTPPDETASIKVARSGGRVSGTGQASVPQVGPLRPGDGG